jgi:hypothetical protein
MAKPEVVHSHRALDPVEAWSVVGRRLIEIDPELFARALSSMSRYVGVFDSHVKQAFDEAMLASILLSASQG